MASKTFVDRVTPIDAEWLNDTNTITYGIGSTASGKGASLIGYKSTLTGASTSRSVQDKLQESVSVKDFGAVSDGNFATGSGTDNLAAFNLAIASLSTGGGGFVKIPAGIYKLSAQLQIPSGISIVGEGSWSSILFCSTAFTDITGLVRVNGTGGYPTRISSLGILSQTGGCTGYGLVSVKNGTFMDNLWVSGFGVGISVGQTDNFLDSFAVELCTTNIYVTQTDVNISNGTVYQGAIGLTVANGAASGNGRVHVSNVRATQQQQTGFTVSAGKQVLFEGCSASADTATSFFTVAAMLVDTSSDVVINGFSAKIGGTPSTTGTGIKFVGGSSDCIVNGSKLTGFVDGITETSCSRITVDGCQLTANGRSGMYLTNGTNIVATGNQCYNNGTGTGSDYGIISSNGDALGVHTVVGNVCNQAVGGNQDYGISATVSGSGYTTIVGNTALNNNTYDIYLAGTTSSIKLSQNMAGTVFDTAPSVASAATVTLPISVDVVSVTGTTTITSITAAGCARRVVTLNFVGVLTLTSGSNLKLASNFVTTNDDTITMYCDGTNWFEIARSVNA
jgi:parallel beta-helix repeat protein